MTQTTESLLTIKPWCGGWIAKRGDLYVANGRTKEECERKARERESNAG